MIIRRTAPFIWSPRQPIGPAFAALSEQPPRDDGRNRWHLFRHTLDLDAVPASALTHITVDGRYILFVNSVQAGRGPVRCSPLAQRYDSWDLAPLLRPGRNAIAVLVHSYGVDTAFHERVRGLWQPVFGDGGLWVSGDLVSSKGAWRCIEATAWDRETPRANHSLGFIESHDARAMPPDWTAPGFDDSRWDEAHILEAGGGGPEAPFGGMSVRPFPILMPRGIPALSEGFATATAVRWVKGQVSQPELPIHKRLYDEALVEPPEGMASDVEGLLGPDARCTVHTRPGLDAAITLDFGRILTGYPAFAIEAKGGETIEIACAERLPGEWTGPVDPEARITRRPLLGHDAHIMRYTARPGVQEFQRFEWCAIRYMHIVVRDAPEGLTIRRLGAVETHYPAEDRGSFACSDPMLTRLWAAGAYTLQQCMHDGWEDCPSREQRQWLGDVTVENVAAWAAFGGSTAPLTAKYLVQAAESQRPDGLTQMFAPGDHGHNAGLIPDWTLQWILCAADHWMLTADRATMLEIWPAIQRALIWFARVADGDGVIADLPYWHFMDWAGLGREGQALALNAQLAGALKAAAIIGRAVGADAAAAGYERRATAILARLDGEHWDAARGVWADSVDPGTRARGLRVSQHGVAALCLWGDPVSDRAASALAYATDPARETQTPAPPVVPHGTPLDEAAGVVMANTFYSHFVGEALVRQGLGETALAGIRRRYRGMIEAGSTTLWEATTPDASLCHGFSASPTWFLSRHVLGVFPLEPGFARIGVRPDLMGLEWAEGIVEAGQRMLSIRLDRTADGFEARIGGGDDAIAVSAPHGWRIASEDRSDDRSDEGTRRVSFRPV